MIDGVEVTVDREAVVVTAGMLLLAFFAQCAWLVRAELTESSDLDAAEAQLAS